MATAPARDSRFGNIMRYHDFAPGGQLVLWASRHWMRAFAGGMPVPVCVWQSFAAAELEDAYVELCGMLTLLAVSGYEPADFAAPVDGGTLTEAEIEIMGMLISLQRADPQSALIALEARSTPRESRAIAAKGARLLLQLSQHGHCVAQTSASAAGERDGRGTRPAALTAVH